MSDITEWFAIKQLDSDNKKFVTISPYLTEDDISFNSRLFNGKLVIYCVTNDDDVYAYESSGDDDDKGYMSEPKKLVDLCQKQVIDIKCGVNFSIALTNCGRVYSWDENDCGQLGHGNTSSWLYFKPTIISALSAKFIVDIKCGEYHSLALTRNGQVFEWGWNAVTKENMTIPVQVYGLRLLTIIAIACGRDYSLVLTDKGEVYSWGMNSKGQLGIANNSKRYTPCKIENLNGDKIVRISCGKNHSMLLSENGDIYVFGANNFGQIGDETTDNKNIPTKLIISTTFVDIATPGFYNYRFSVGLSVDGFCYVWGKCDKVVITSPTKTQFKNIDEVMMKYSRYKVTYKPYYFNKTFENMTPLERFKETFNNSESKLNDIKFKIDGKYIFVQKQYLISVCQHFDTLFSNEWIESTKNEIEITQYSYSVYHSFLKYLYTNCVDIQSKDLIELYYLSDSYFEQNLKKKCVKIMKEVINVNNAINFYAFSVKNNYKELENYTFDYMKNCINDIFKSESYNEMNDISICKKLFETLFNNEK